MATATILFKGPFTALEHEKGLKAILGLVTTITSTSGLVLAPMTSVETGVANLQIVLTNVEGLTPVDASEGVTPTVTISDQTLYPGRFLIGLIGGSASVANVRYFALGQGVV